MASARENDLNPDVRIGLKVPFARDRAGLFGQTDTTLEQAGYNIHNLLLTAKGERVMQPDFGSGLRTLLFEQHTDDLERRVEEAILDSVSTWLPYVKVTKINITQKDNTPNTINVDIKFSLNYEPDRFNTITLNVEGE